MASHFKFSPSVKNKKKLKLWKLNIGLHRFVYDLGRPEAMQKKLIKNDKRECLQSISRERQWTFIYNKNSPARAVKYD